jgi:hypothetical protein
MGDSEKRLASWIFGAIVVTLYFFLSGYALHACLLLPRSLLVQLSRAYF